MAQGRTARISGQLGGLRPREEEPGEGMRHPWPTALARHSCFSSESASTTSQGTRKALSAPGGSSLGGGSVRIQASEHMQDESGPSKMAEVMSGSNFHSPDYLELTAYIFCVSVSSLQSTALAQSVVPSISCMIDLLCLTLFPVFSRLA